MALSWLALAVVWGTLHGWIVPRIGEYRPWLEAQASQALGLPVRIGAISAESTGLIPSFALRDVALLDAQGRTALLLPQVTVALSPASLLKRGFEQLVIDQPALDIRRSADGQLFVAGLAIPHTSSSGDSPALDWLFAQTELVVRGGTVRWTDEQRNAPPLALSGVDFVMRNRGLHHALRLDASPPADWGDRFSIRAQLQQPLLSLHRGRWQDWTGPVYASLPRVDVLQLRPYANVADLGFDLAQGVGALRVWADVRRGQLDGGTADVALQDVQMTLAPGLQPLALNTLQGRLTARRLADGGEFSTEGLQFTTADGLPWPGGNLFASLRNGDKRTPAQGQFRADRLDLATLARIASSLPLGAATHEALATVAPEGLVEQISASWRGALPDPAQFDAQGRVTGLVLAAEPAPPATAAVPHPLGRPGVRGATVDFALTQAGGKATLALGTQEQGSMEFPGVFDDPVVPFDQLSATLAWQPQPFGWAVQASDLRFANADGAGTLQVRWQHSDPVHASSHARSPGVLDLQGQLTRANLARVHRYLPLELDAEVRNYVRDAVLAGTSNKVKFNVKGDLWDFPYNTTKQGEFHLSADVQNASYAYVPASHSPGPHWPALEQLNGELVFDRASLQVHRASAKLHGAAAVHISQGEVQIADLGHTLVDFKAQARGPLADMLGVLARSPLAGSSAKTLEQASVNGMADLKLALQLPITQIDKSKAQGSLTLPGNDLLVAPDTPTLGKAQGVLNFTESGFTVAGGQARLLGGDVKIDSAVQPNATADASPLLRLQGVATADGLRQAPGLGPVPWLAQHASGSTAYTAVLGLRRGVPEFSVRSNLQGLALNLPAPLNKAADTSLLLRVDNALLPGASGPLRDHLSVALGNIASVAYVRDISGAEAKVLRGVLTVGQPSAEPVALPNGGVSANLNLGQANVDAWEAILPNTHTKGNDTSADGYLPTQLTLRANALTVGGRTLHTLVLGGSRDASTWRANVDAQELSGYLEYRLPADTNGGRLYARLARLNLAPGEAGVDPIQDSPLDSVPALDIVVDALQLKDKKLGRFEVDAINRRSGDTGGREWRLNKLSLSNPDAQLNATGNWVAAQSSPTGPRRTALNFKLDIADAGALLTRLGMPGVIRRGKGVMEGRAAWVGSPLALDTPTLGGQFNLAVDNGQFLKADPGLAKLLGVLNLQALPRRLTLDFRDVFSEGFGFDFIRGDVRIDQGTATTNNLQMKGVNAAVLMDGSADIGRETQNLKVVVVPDLNAGTASLVAAVINPAIGLGTFLAQWFLKRPLTEAATQEFHIDGTWADPKITKVPHTSTPVAETQAPSPSGTSR